MAKSSYLDNLINNKLSMTKPRYLSELWDTYSDNTYDTYRFSALNNFTNEVLIEITGSDYLNNLNTNQSVLNMNNPMLSKITLNSAFLPAVRRNNISGATQKKTATSIKLPPEYLPARITSVKGSITRTIPILFPASFSRSMSAHFAKENPVGSVIPIVAYSYTDAEEIPFEFDALSDYLPSDFHSLNEYVEAILDILRPSHNADGVIFEPTVIVEFADMYFKGICNSVSINYDNVYDYKSFVHARISCQFTKLS